MLKKSQRLAKKDIERFFAGRFKNYKLNNILLRVARNESGAPKFAFIVSSSIKRNAVARNLLRRRMSEISKELSPGINKGLDLVFSFKLLQKKAVPFKQLKDDMIKLLSLCGAL